MDQQQNSLKIGDMSKQAHWPFFQVSRTTNTILHMKETLQRPVSREKPGLSPSQQLVTSIVISRTWGMVDLRFEPSHHDGDVPFRIRRLSEEVSEILAFG